MFNVAFACMNEVQELGTARCTINMNFTTEIIVVYALTVLEFILRHWKHQ